MANSKQTRPRSKVRPGARKKVVFSTDRPTLVSLGTSERRILQSLQEVEDRGERWSRRAYARLMNYAPSTIKSQLDRLVDKGLVHYHSAGDPRITEEGETALELVSGGSRSSRRDGRGAAQNLSVHHARFIMPLVGVRPVDTLERLKGLGALDLRVVKLNNFEQYVAYFEGLTAVVNRHQVVFRVHDVLVDDVDEAHVELFERVLPFVERFEKIGLQGEGLRMQKEHYARVASFLGDALEKIDGRFSLDLGNGRRFWIDHSTGPVEDETDDPEYRKRLDDVLRSVGHSSSDFEDLDKLKAIVADLVKLRVLGDGAA